MAVSLRVTGAWAELTADGAVAIPATPQAGDRMFLFARWKDFSITAQVTSPVAWTEITEFADGAITSGNGTGSVKVGCWYRDWQSGDTDPTLDFSASPDNASVVIMVMQKDADDVWATPVFKTAAMTNWTTTSQIVSASATAIVPSGGVVMGLIGIRDDTATMTRPTTGIDDSSGAITWNGNYVESPATHHSTTTGFDGAADLGYRLVSIGATATLRMTGTISAAETGAALWIIQGTTIVVTPSPATLEISTLTPTLKTSVIPAIASLAITAFMPTLKTSVIPETALLMISTFAPTLKFSVTPGFASLAVTLFAPTLASSVTPATANLTISGLSPMLVSSVIPATANLTISTFTPSLVSAVTPTSLSLSISTFSPTLWPPNLIYLDPGGDAVQAVGHFNSDIVGTVTYDTAQKVVGVGVYKFDSGSDLQTVVSVEDVLFKTGIASTGRRLSFYWRYDSVPDAQETAIEFVGGNVNYSGDGFYRIVFQEETLTVVGTVTGSGNATFTIMSNLVTGTPLDVSVAVLAGDTAADVAAKAAVVLNANADVNPHFTFTANGADLILTVIEPAVHDSAINITFTNDTCTGLTPNLSGEASVTTVAGVFEAGNHLLSEDDEFYGQARPAQNSGLGVAYSSLGLDIPIGAIIDSVKLIYERKYDIDTSIGISRVKWRVNGVEGPNHDNTDQPLTDTVVEVDVTADRGWTWQDLQDGEPGDGFEVIAEARRGNTATAHMQSWDFLKVEVVYHLPAGILWGMNDSLTTLGFQLAVTPQGDGVVVRFVDGAGVSYDGITELAIDTWHRISLGFIHHDTDDLDIKVYVDGLEELSVVGASTNGAADVSHLQYGWRLSPGVDHVSWFDQFYIDDGDDLSDPGNVLMTAKLPASVNENNWSTTGGTGAVNERPLSETNYMKETEGIVRVRQSYTLQAASVGDVDLTGKTLVGHMGWAWFKVSATGEPIDLVVNGVNIDVTAQASTVPALTYHAETSNAYPSNAAGIGMRSAPELLDTFMYEIGAIIAYEGPPPVPPPLLEYQLLAEDSITERSDDLGAEEAETYTLRSEIGESADAVVTTTIYADVGGVQHQQVVIESHGGDEIGHTVIAPGGEVSTSTEVTGGDAEVGLERIPDVE